MKRRCQERQWRIVWTIAAAKNSASLSKCPSCSEGSIESVPVAEDEEYKFDYDIKRGVTMKFFR